MNCKGRFLIPREKYQTNPNFIQQNVALLTISYIDNILK